VGKKRLRRTKETARRRWEAFITSENGVGPGKKRASIQKELGELKRANPKSSKSLQKKKRFGETEGGQSVMNAVEKLKFRGDQR